ncbi:DUF4190 domain-containing protein, partial [Rathayibacter tanaceti]
PPVYGTPLPPAPAPPSNAAPPYPAASAHTFPPGSVGSPAPVVPRTLSLVGMILGIVGLVVSIFAWGFGFILSAPAVVLGFLGRRREPGARGLALTAIITGVVGILVSLVYLAITIVVFSIALGAVNSGS